MAETPGILGIPNRTENWKTAKTLSICIAKKRQHLVAARIIENAGFQARAFKSSDTVIELFWKGFRDYCKANDKDSNSSEFIKETSERYRQLFPDLLWKVQQYNRGAPRNRSLRINPANNYACAHDTESTRTLFDNLRNTEVDIALSAPGFLLVGEAKSEEAFGADSNHILPHQLLRQYVMARVLLETKRFADIRVIPFIVGENREQILKCVQVKLLHALGYLNLANVMSWDELSETIPENALAS